MNPHTAPETSGQSPVAIRSRLLVKRYSGLVLLVALLLLAPAASAAAPDLIWRAPDMEGKPGSGAGRLDNPRGVVASPVSGHLYVSEYHNARVSEFTAWGAFVRAWGWDVAPEGAPGDTASDQLEICTSLCKAGVKGDGAGQLNAARGIALDAAGNVYLHESTIDPGSRRVQKFSPTGEFLLMFGGEVDKTTKANVCTKADLEAGHECGAGVEGTGPGQFSNQSVGNYIAYRPATGTILVGDIDRIEEFGTEGSFKSQIPFEGALTPFDGKSVNSLAVGPEGNLYLSFDGLEDLYKVSPSGEPLAPGKPGESKFEAEVAKGVALDGEGTVYVADDTKLGSGLEDRLLAYSPSGSKLFPSEAEEEAEEFFPYLPFHGPAINGIATNLCPGSEAPGSLYLSAFEGSAIGGTAYLESYGTAPAGCEPPPPNPPQIASQYATSVGLTDATLGAEINPRFWQDATYYVQYGTGKCSEGGCEAQVPLGPGAGLTPKSLNRPVPTHGVFLSGLTPDTTYHYRFVAKSSGGGPVRGVGGTPIEDGAEASFHTFAPTAEPDTDCPNQAFRTGPSAFLPDCRAYEMVSPLDKAGGDAGLDIGPIAGMSQAAVSGDRFAYTSYTAFADPEASSFVSTYLATREGQGSWSNAAINPPRTLPPGSSLLLLNNEFRGFSPDLCSAWVRHFSVVTLAAGAVPEFPNLYRRQNCGQSPGYEAITTAEPLYLPADEYNFSPLGYSADETVTIFNADDALVAGAPDLGPESAEGLLYLHGPNGLRFLCYLPNGQVNPTACGAGMAAGMEAGKLSSVQGAISADGSRVYWTAYSSSLNGAPEGVGGKIYLRVNPEEPQSNVSSGKCTEPEKACTIAVSGPVTPERSEYWSASEDGSKAIFMVGAGPLEGNVYEFDALTKKSRLIATGAVVPMGASEDASRVYFASDADLDGAGAASAGDLNLYLYEAPEEGGEGTIGFVMELAQEDKDGSELLPSPISELPALRSSVISADGRFAAFTSSVSPTPSGYDNLDAQSGKPDDEAYVYDAETGKLRCVSCNPSGARPVGENVATPTVPSWAAAKMARPRVPLQRLRALSADGQRLFFESHEALVPRDTNGAWDVYQWEAAGKGGCDEADPTYGEAAEGCVELISSGKSPQDSRFLDADESGNNVFIATLSSLAGADYGLTDVYDARVGGGFAEPQPPVACEGEACQGPLSPPDDPTPASSSFQGAGNVKAERPRCPKGKVRRKGRCVKPRKAKHHKRANHKRRAGR